VSKFFVPVGKERMPIQREREAVSKLCMTVERARAPVNKFYMTAQRARDPRLRERDPVPLACAT
jgi:hypothetical protein